LSCGTGRREIRGDLQEEGYQGLLHVFLCVIVIPTKGDFKETHNCTPYAKWGVVSLKAPSRGIFQSSPVLMAGRVKTGIVVHGILIRDYTLFSAEWCNVC